MKTGDLVWSYHNGLLRFGTVVSKRKENKWAYFTVNWHADDAHAQDIQWRKKLTHIDHSLKEYRADMLNGISAKRLMQVLEEHTYGKENKKDV